MPHDLFGADKSALARHLSDLATRRANLRFLLAQPEVPAEERLKYLQLLMEAETELSRALQSSGSD